MKSCGGTQHTDVNRLNPDAFLYVGSLGAVTNLVRQNF
jgi:hypothetical protein